jgi:hypothetical protein
MTNLNDYINIAVDNFEKVIIFKFFNALKKYYDNSPEKYIQVTNLLSKTIKTQDDLKLINQFNSLFQIDKSTIEKIVTKPRINNIRTCITSKVLKLVEEHGIIKRFNHRNINYKSGKSFTMCNAYVVDTKHIQNYFNNKNISNPSSEFYTKKQCKLITKFILEYNKSEDIIVTNNFILKENNMKTKRSKRKNDKQKIVTPENDIQDTIIDNTKKINLVEKCCKANVLSKKMGEHILKTFYGINHTIKYSPINEDLMKTENSKMRLKILTNLLKKYRSQIDEDEYKYFEKLCKDLCKIHCLNFDDLIKAIIK